MQILDISLIVIGYLLGSVSSAIIVCRLMGLPDPRTQGSKNPGATNVLRFGGKKAAAIVLLGDTLKGIVPVAIAIIFNADNLTLALVGGLAFLGHLYPIFFSFQGGKGVATAFGVFIALSWQVSLALIGTWLLFAKVFKISSLAALIAAVLTPVYVWFLAPDRYFIIMSIMFSLLLIWRHRSNIKNLLDGSEDSIGTDVDTPTQDK